MDYEKRNDPFEGRHPSVQHFRPLFAYGHLSPWLQSFSEPFFDLVENMLGSLGDSPELTAGLRKLLEAKDCFVRSAVLNEESFQQRVKKVVADVAADTRRVAEQPFVMETEPPEIPLSQRLGKAEFLEVPALGDRTVEDEENVEDGDDEEVPCACVGLQHQFQCPNWVMPH